MTLREVQSLTGLLNFACSIILPGRAFLRRRIDLTVGIQSPFHFIRLKREVKADVEVLQEFLDEYNCKSFFLEDFWHTSELLNLYIDASGSLGFGALFQNRWCYGSWPPSWTTYNFAALDFFPIVLSLFLWGSAMSNHAKTSTLCFLCVKWF